MSDQLDGGGVPKGHRKFFRNGKAYYRVTAEGRKMGIKHYKSGRRSASKSSRKSSSRKSPSRKLHPGRYVTDETELMKLIPKTFKIYANPNVSEVTLATRLYGKHMKPLTPRIIKGLQLSPGDMFYGLMGTGWENPQTSEDRYTNIITITYEGFVNPAREGELQREVYEDGDNIIINGQEAVECGGPGRKTYGTGPNCDQVYIFIK